MPSWVVPSKSLLWLLPCCLLSRRGSVFFLRANTLYRLSCETLFAGKYPLIVDCPVKRFSRATTLPDFLRGINYPLNCRLFGETFFAGTYPLAGCVVKLFSRANAYPFIWCLVNRVLRTNKIPFVRRLAKRCLRSKRIPALRRMSPGVILVSRRSPSRAPLSFCLAVDRWCARRRLVYPLADLPSRLRLVYRTSYTRIPCPAA